jgi:hypothetical protein
MNHITTITEMLSKEIQHRAFQYLEKKVKKYLYLVSWNLRPNQEPE